MGRLKGNINSGFSGKVGSIVGYRMRDKDFIRSLPKKISKNPSEAQLVSRAKFSIIQKWRTLFTSIFAITFKNHSHEHSAQNAAHKLNAKIIKGEYPAFEIDWSKVVFSQGNLPFVADLAMNFTDGHLLELSWNPNVEKGAKTTDLVAIIAVYDQGSNYHAELAAAQRSAGKCRFSLTIDQGHQIADIYFSILSNDRTKAANSCYLGRFDLTP